MTENERSESMLITSMYQPLYPTSPPDSRKTKQAQCTVKHERRRGVLTFELRAKQRSACDKHYYEEIIKPLSD
jgi:hypothetical protein